MRVFYWISIHFSQDLDFHIFQCLRSVQSSPTVGSYPNRNPHSPLLPLSSRAPVTAALVGRPPPRQRFSALRVAPAAPPPGHSALPAHARRLSAASTSVPPAHACRGAAAGPRRAARLLLAAAGRAGRGSRAPTSCRTAASHRCSSACRAAPR